MKQNGVVVQALMSQLAAILAVVALAFVFASAHLLPINQAHADEVTERTDIAVVDFQILNEDGSTPETIKQNRWYDLKLAWDASAYGNTLKAGDYFLVTLPNQMRFPSNHSATHFPITAPDGNIVANAVITPDEAGGGGVTVTFTDYVEGRDKITGTMFMNARVSISNTLADEENHFVIEMGSTVVSLDVVVEGHIQTALNPNETLSKWYLRGSSTDEYVQWEARINYAGRTIPNAVITDVLQTEDGNLEGLAFIPESFVLQERRFDEYGNTIWRGQQWDLEALGTRLQFNDDMTAFRLDMGDVDGMSYLLRYRTTYSPGITLTNIMRLEGGEGAWAASSSFTAASSGGSGEGVVPPEPEPEPEPEPDPEPEPPAPNVPEFETPTPPSTPELKVEPNLTPEPPAKSNEPSKDEARIIPKMDDLKPLIVLLLAFAIAAIAFGIYHDRK